MELKKYCSKEFLKNAAPPVALSIICIIFYSLGQLVTVTSIPLQASIPISIISIFLTFIIYFYIFLLFRKKQFSECAVSMAVMSVLLPIIPAVFDSVNYFEALLLILLYMGIYFVILFATSLIKVKALSYLALSVVSVFIFEIANRMIDLHSVTDRVFPDLILTSEIYDLSILKYSVYAVVYAVIYLFYLLGMAIKKWRQSKKSDTVNKKFE